MHTYMECTNSAQFLKHHWLCCYVQFYGMHCILAFCGSLVAKYVDKEYTIYKCHWAIKLESWKLALTMITKLIWYQEFIIMNIDNILKLQIADKTWVLNQTAWVWCHTIQKFGHDHTKVQLPIIFKMIMTSGTLRVTYNWYSSCSFAILLNYCLWSLIFLQRTITQLKQCPIIESNHDYIKYNIIWYIH